MEVESFSGADLAGANFAGASVTGYGISEESFRTLDFTGAKLDLPLSGANLSGSGTRLSGVFFALPYLTGVNFSNVNLTGANFGNTSLQDTTFAGANLTGADLSRANLTGLVISGSTILPDGSLASSVLDAGGNGTWNGRTVTGWVIE